MALLGGTWILIFLAQALFAATTVVFDPSRPDAGPFPTDFLTVPDAGQKTGSHVQLPPTDCSAEATACVESRLLQQLDGFSLRTRMHVRFSAAVNTDTLRSGIFLVALDNLTAEEPGIHHPGDVIRINQVVYDPAGNTVYAKPDSVLDQHRRYALVATDAVQDTAGSPVVADPAYLSCLMGSSDYCGRLAAAVITAQAAAAPHQIVGASLFTTMSATAWLEASRAILPNISPAPALLMPQSAFRLADFSGIVLHEQTGANPSRFTDYSFPLPAALLMGLDRMVIGSFQSPQFLQADQTIQAAPTLAALSVPAATNQVYFNALLPSAPKPDAGYPVVIFCHGFGDSRFGGPTAVAPALARSGFATIAINAVGHGFGPESTITFVDPGGNGISIPAGGRGVDVNGDGVIEPIEGCALVAPVALGLRDCFRQTVTDLLQLVQVIRAGLDLDGDGRPDLDAQHIYYAGQSLGAMYGTMLTALEPGVRAAALNVGGATVVDIARWSPAYRPLAAASLGLRMPPLLNQGNDYREDYVLPDQPVKVVNTAGAIAIQNVFENLEWLGMQGDPAAFAPHLKVSPLPGTAPRPVLMQFARGDETVPNPANSVLIRAAGMEQSTWVYRHDLARAKSPDLPENPHPFLVLFLGLDGGTVQLPSLAGLAISLDAQQQVAGFLMSDGIAIPNPNVLAPLLLGFPVFEIPAALPQDLGF